MDTNTNHPGYASPSTVPDNQTLARTFNDEIFQATDRRLPYADRVVAFKKADAIERELISRGYWEPTTLGRLPDHTRAELFRA